MIERQGAVTGLLTTRGFGDVLDLARERRYDLFDLRLTFPAPLIPRPLRREVGERIRYDGEVLQPLDLAEVERAVGDLVGAHRIESLAVCLVHASINPAHEDRIRALVRERFPQLSVSTSAEVFPFMGEYERFTTTTINAYVQPMVDRYLSRLERELALEGFGGTLYVVLRPRDGPPLPRPAPRVGARGRGLDVRDHRAPARRARPPRLRHGRDHREGLHHPGT